MLEAKFCWLKRLKIKKENLVFFFPKINERKYSLEKQNYVSVSNKILKQTKSFKYLMFLIPYVVKIF